MPVAEDNRGVPTLVLDRSRSFNRSLGTQRSWSDGEMVRDISLVGGVIQVVQSTGCDMGGSEIIQRPCHLCETRWQC